MQAYSNPKRENDDHALPAAPELLSELRSTQALSAQVHLDNTELHKVVRELHAVVAYWFDSHATSAEIVTRSRAAMERAERILAKPA